MIEFEKEIKELEEKKLDEKEQKEILSYFNYERKKCGQQIKESRLYLEEIEEDYSNIVQILEYIENDKPKKVTKSVVKYLEILLFDTILTHKLDPESYNFSKSYYERKIELLRKLLEELKWN